MKKILFVDDDDTYLLLMEKSLKKFNPSKNWDVSFASNGCAALTKMLSESINDSCTTLRDYDVVITDINMPHMNGFELINNIIAKFPDTKFIIVSSHVTNDIKKHFSDSSNNIILSKPVDRNALFELIDKLA